MEHDAGATCRQKTRLRRAAVYQRTAEPDAEEAAYIRAAAYTECPSGNAGKQLSAQWTDWHKRAEVVFEKTVKLQLAVAVAKAERPKGSRPTARNVSVVAPHTMADGGPVQASQVGPYGGGKVQDRR